jgi:hypothetical protein
VLIYNGRVYLLVYSRTQDTGLNAIRSTDWHSSKTKKAILAAAGVVAAGALGNGAYQLGSNLLASQSAAAAAAREAERNLLLRGVSGIASENTQNITKQMSAGFDQTQNAINTGFGQLDSKVSAGFNQTQNAMNTGLDQLGSKLGGQLDRGLFQVQNTAANQGQILKTFTQNQMERNSLIGLGRQGGRATVAGAKAVGNATVASARAAGRGVRAAGKGVWNAGGSLVTGTAEGVKTIGRGITGAGRAIGNIFSRNPKSLPQK